MWYHGIIITGLLIGALGIGAWHEYKKINAQVEGGSDVDADGIPNSEDDDIDGDNVVNVEDSDMDGDGISNQAEQLLGSDPKEPTVLTQIVTSDGNPAFDLRALCERYCK